jgi:hypothetical protein
VKPIAIPGRSTAAVLLFLIILAPAAGASELSAFNSAVADAYGHYRQASFYLRRSASPDVAALELESFIEKWQAVVERFADAPPDAFADDPQWGGTLKEIASRAGTALAALDSGDAEAAGETLAPVRGLLGDLRRRNGVTTYSDLIDALSAEMRVFLKYRRNPPDFSDRGQVDAMLRQAAVVGYLFDRCEARAPEELLANAEFKRQIDGARESMVKVWKAAETGNPRLLGVGIGELRSFERIMFLRFG